jgi:hypothetical protein
MMDLGANDDRQPPHRPRPKLLAKQKKKPGKWPGFFVTDDSTHL